MVHTVKWSCSCRSLTLSWPLWVFTAPPPAMTLPQLMSLHFLVQLFRALLPILTSTLYSPKYTHSSFLCFILCSKVTPPNWDLPSCSQSRCYHTFKQLLFYYNAHLLIYLIWFPCTRTKVPKYHEKRKFASLTLLYHKVDAQQVFDDKRNKEGQRRRRIAEQILFTLWILLITDSS